MADSESGVGTGAGRMAFDPIIGNDDSTITKDALALRLYDILTGHYSFDELWDIATELDIDLDTLPGDSKSSKARELITYAKRHGRLSELADIVRRTRPHLVGQNRSTFAVQSSDSEVTNLNLELSGLRQQISELRQASTDIHIEERLREILKTANRAVGRSEELSARIILPSQDVTDVHLIPTHSLDHLEEYRSDENIVYLLIGAFSGAILGVLSNWATTEPFVITRFSIVLLSILAVLTVACIFWAWRLRKRTTALKERFLNHSISSDHPREQRPA